MWKSVRRCARFSITTLSASPTGPPPRRARLTREIGFSVDALLGGSLDAIARAVTKRRCSIRRRGRGGMPETEGASTAQSAHQKDDPTAGLVTGFQHVETGSFPEGNGPVSPSIGAWRHTAIMFVRTLPDLGPDRIRTDHRLTRLAAE